jgi:adenylate cyclase
MAMQDALHEFNLVTRSEEQIHIRIAASLGEVRVTRTDIFGEPVNVTSRIEGITPADEIYFSEAVYLAMNKAEVPAIEVGLHDLKGISKPVRIFAIPRFVENRLVPTSQTVPNDPDGLSFPYGGMHLASGSVSTSWMHRITTEGKRFVPDRAAQPFLGIASIVLLGLGLFLLWPFNLGPVGQSSEQIGLNRIIGNSDARQRIQASMTAPILSSDDRAGIKFNHTNGEPEAANKKEEVVMLETVPANTPTQLPTSTPVPTFIPKIAPTLAPVASPIPVLIETSKPLAKTSSSSQSSQSQQPKKSQITNILQAKQAYRAGKIDKAAYRSIVDRLENQLDEQVRAAKLAYKAGKFSKDVLRQKIIALKIRYIGSD